MKRKLALGAAVLACGTVLAAFEPSVDGVPDFWDKSGRVQPTVSTVTSAENDSSVVTFFKDVKSGLLKLADGFMLIFK